MTDTAQVTMEKIETITKRGFDPKERLLNRGLRKATIVLYLDEELGPELGWAVDVRNQIGEFSHRERGGVIGELDNVESTKQAAKRQYESNIAKMTPEEAEKVTAAYESIVSAFDERIAELTVKRDELIAKLTETAFTVKLRAVPPVIEKDMKRRARATLGIEEKGIPEDRSDEYYVSRQLHLLSEMVQSLKDNQSGIVNEEFTYEDAQDFLDQLPPGQWDRLDAKLYEVQYTDAISRTIEGQEDFS